MVTLKQLQKENARLKKAQQKLDEISKGNERRRKLAMENKRLAREIKFGGTIRKTKKVSSAVGSVGKKAGKEVLKGGIIAFKGLQRYGKFLEEQEKKQKSLNRKLRSAKKTKSVRKTKRRK